MFAINDGTTFGAKDANFPVVLYLRKSNKSKSKSRDETISIRQQREEVQEWCEQRGWTVLREYVDDGKSASKNDTKRVEFTKMLADVTDLGDFRAVVVWDLSRLTRKDSVDASNAATVFKTRRVLVESLRDNEIDLNTEMGRHMWNLHCEGNHAFARKVSSGTIRGRNDALKSGRWPHGKVPYGYRRQYWDGEKLVADLHRRDPAGKARHWVTKVVPDPDEAKFAAQIIRDFATRDVSVRGLAIELTKAGVPTINGKPWSTGHVKDILRCPVYVGDIGVGYSWGWQQSVKGKGYEAHGHSPRQIQPNSCPAIIDRTTWERAYNKLNTLKASGRRVHSAKASPLSGIIYCGHCGKVMAKNAKKGVVRFVCSTAAKNSACKTCRQWTVREDDLLPIFVRRLVDAIDFKLLKDLVPKAPELAKTRTVELRRQEADLTKQVSNAARNLALCDQENFTDVQTVLNELRNELDRVRDTLKLDGDSSGKSDQQQAAQWWGKHRDRVLYLALPAAKAVEAFKEWGVENPNRPSDGRVVATKAVIPASSCTFRDLLKQLNARLTLYFKPKARSENAKKQYYSLEWGRLEATLAGHSFDASRPERTKAPTATRCGRALLRPVRSKPNDSTTATPTPA